MRPVFPLKTLPATLMFLLLWGCATPPPKLQQGELQWPQSPFPTRVEWLEEIRDYRAAAGSKGLWQRLADVVLGDRPAPFVRPYGVLSGSRDRIVVADTGAARLLIMDRAGKKSTVVGGRGEPRFLSPIAVAEDDRENLYVTDSAAGAIFRYRLREKKLERFVPHRLERPTGIAFNPRNRLLYVSETLAHQVVAYNLGGLEEFRIGARGDAPGQFNFPTDLFVDRKGQLYVTDALNHRIQVFTPRGQLVAHFGQTGDAAGYLPKPKGVAVDSEGHIYVVDALLDAVQIFDEDGRLLLDFGRKGNRPGEFWMPTGISIDESDTIYVTDTYNQRIQVFRFVADSQAPGGGQAARPEAVSREGWEGP